MSLGWGVGAQFGVGGVAGSSVTLVGGTSFVISAPGGDIEPGGAEGLFHRDTRYLSTWRLSVDGSPLQPLSVFANDPFAATFLSLVEPRIGYADSTLFVVRERFVGGGMREDIVLRNLGSEAAACSVTIEFAADFAHLFEVKEDRVEPRGEQTVEIGEDEVSIAFAYRDRKRRVRVKRPPGWVATAHSLISEVVVPARGEWSVCIEVELEMDTQPVDLLYRGGGRVEHSAPATSLRRWERTAPSVRTEDERVNRTLARSILDLGSLRIFDPDDPEQAVIAAGAPWFMTLFGRDSIITSQMTLIVDPRLAISTLRTLARYQGEREDPRSEEQPGRILHEIRAGLGHAVERNTDSIYYGSIDSTPLFVMLLAELHDWGVDDAIVDELLPAADRALGWIEQYGDQDGDGFVEYQRATDRGLVNQGWKDSFDGINFASGRMAEPPLALCEVQGYVYAAYLGRARIARSRGDQATAGHYAARAERLRQAFNDRFWLDELGYFALGLDGDKRPIDALTSNIGHCLWTGIVDESRAESVAKHLLAGEMFSGWGLRTLASTMGAYNPVSYHNGSVWPHDSAICAAGLMRYGFVAEAQAVAQAVFDAAAAFDGRLPELLCGFGRAEFAAPVSYPTSCSPQAWASATPYSLLRTLLRLDPAGDDSNVYIAPVLPESFGAVHVEQIQIGTDRVTIDASGARAEMSGLSVGTHIVGGPRPVEWK